MNTPDPKMLLNKGKEITSKTKQTIVGGLDQNGDGEIGIEDIIVLSVKTPGVHIERTPFLQKELFKNHPQDVIDRAIATTPAQAGIEPEEIDKIADAVIAYERNCVSGISAALGAPGGWAMAATVPADIIQYYGYTLRATQKLLYLYGFPEIKADEEGIYLDSETINTIILCLGVMSGVAGANNAIKAMAKALSVGVEKKLLNTALTKGAFYPFVKKTMKWFGVRLTKSVFAGFFKKSIPVVGGVIGGGFTFLSFRPCCARLQRTLRDTMLSDPSHVASDAENMIVEEVFAGGIAEAEIIDSSGDIGITPKLSPVRAELYRRLQEIWDHEDFILGVLSFAAHDEDSQVVLDYIESGEDVTTDSISLLALDLHIKRYGE